MIDYHECKVSRIYCAFVNYRKAFDMVHRISIWPKVISEGIWR